MDELILLNRIRVDIGNVSGSLIELLQYAGMAGFNDNYEPQTKPRLVGTWTINNYYTPAQLAQAQAAFDGLTIVGDSNYVLDFSQMAVQTLDPSQPNYNPAVAIILQGQNVGTTTASAPLGHGRWFLTKTQAAAVTIMRTGNTPWFYTKSTVVDTNGIVTQDTSISYGFDSFNEFQYFGVTTVEANYFAGCSKLVSITLPNVTSIGNTAFSELSSLESVHLPNTITTISYRAFFRCYKLKTINLPQSLTSLGDEVFYWCGYNQTFTEEDFIDINLPNLTSLSNGCFANVKFLNNVDNLGLVSTIPRNCFVGSSIKSIVIPNTVTSIGHEAFYECFSLENVQLPKNTLTSIGNDAFRTDYKLKSINFPTSLTGVGSNAFAFTGRDAIFSSEELISLNLPNLTTLNNGSFLSFKAISEVINLGSITTIPSNCFAGCANLKSVIIPNTVTSLNEKAFYECPNLENITLSSTLETISKEVFRNSQKLKMPILPQSITTIGQYAFFNSCKGTPEEGELIDINLPNLTYFDTSSEPPISVNKYIKKIINLGTITELGRNAFGDCSNLIEATLPSTITTFKDAGLFNNIAANAIIHLLSETPITIPYSIYIFKPSSVKVYVGDGSSSTHDDAILADYLAASNWSYYSSQLDTWYNYLHPQS